MRASSRRVCSSGAHLEPVFDEHDAGFDDRLLHLRRDFEKALHLLHRAEFHHPLDAGAIVPAAVKDHDLAGGRKMAHVALHIHLRLFPIGRRGQRDDAEHARTDALGDRLDHPALAGAVAALEQRRRPSGPCATTQSCSLTSSACRRASSRSYVLLSSFSVSLRAVPFVGLTAFALTFCRSHASLPVLRLQHRRACLVKGLRAWTQERRCEGGAFAAASRGG